MYNRNAAYDFSPLEKEQHKKAKIFKLPNKSQRQKEKSKALKMVIYSAFSMFFMSAVGVSGFISGQAKLTEYTDKVAKASKQLDQCQSENTALMLKNEALKSSKVEADTSRSSVEIVKISGAEAGTVK